MKMVLVGYQHITPKSGKAPFTNLYTEYMKNGVESKATESIYVADGFPLPNLKVGMTIDVDRDGGGYLLEIAAVAPQASNQASNPVPVAKAK